MKIIFLGAPGAGKGTQAAIVSQRLSIPAISTGNIIRESMKSGGELGQKARSYVESGKLVPDGVVIGMLKERIADGDCRDGFILDGYPRTVPQAQALDEMGVLIDKVIDIEVPDEVIQERLGGRLVCASCSDSYHVKHNPPKSPDVCDKCGAALTQRPDDRPETVRERLRVYHEQTEPLKDYYHAVGKLYVVQGQEGVENATRQILATIEA